jgi:pimeloyl-ACP methyl ester carboxylesterase
MGIPKLALVGHGLGAMVAVEYARRHEDKVPRLLISGAPLFDPGDLATRSKVIPAKTTINPNPEPVPVNHPEATVMSVNSAMRAALADAAARRGTAASAASNPASTPIATLPSDHINNMLRKRLIEEKKVNPQRLLDLCFKSTEPEHKKLQADVSKADARAIEASMEVFDAGTMLDSLRRLSSPVVAVHGLQDDVIEPPGDKVWDYLTIDKGNTLQPVLLEGVRHFPMLEHDRFFRLLNDFLEAPDVSKLEIKERWTRRSH